MDLALSTGRYLHPGYDDKLPMLVHLSSTNEGNASAPLSYLLQNIETLGDLKPSRLLVRAFLPATDSGALAESLRVRWKLQESGACTTPAKGATLCRPEQTEGQRVFLLLRERSHVVEVDVLLGPNRRSPASDDEDMLAIGSETPPGQQVFAAAAEDLRRSHAVVLSHVTARRLSALQSAYLIHNYGGGYVPIGADRMMFASYGLLESQMTFLQNRIEVESWNIALGFDGGVWLTADATLSRTGLKALDRGFRWFGFKRDDFSLRRAIPADQVVPGFCFHQSQNRTHPCISDRSSPNMSAEETWVAALQAPLLLSRSIAESCLPRSCSAEDALGPLLFETLGRGLGLDQARLWKDGPRSARFSSRFRTGTAFGRMRATPEDGLQVQAWLREKDQAAENDPFPPWPAPLFPPTPDPVVAPQGGKGWGCLEAGLTGIRSLLRSCLEPHDLWPGDLGPRAASAQAALSCALDAPETREVARAWDEALTMFRAERAQARLRVSELLDVLKEGCKKGYQKACGQLSSAERLRKLAIAQSDCPCASELALFEKRCGRPLMPWHAPRINIMDEHGQIDQSQPSSFLAIDRRAVIRDVRGLLENGGPTPPKAEEYLHLTNGGPSLLPVFVQGDGTAVHLPPLALAHEADCRVRTIIHHYSLSGNELRDETVDQKTCAPSTAKSRTNHLFDLPDETPWGTALQKLCRVACGDTEADSFSLLAKQKTRSEPRN